MKARYFGFLLLLICVLSCKTNNRVSPYEYALLSAHVYNDGTKQLPEKFQTFQTYEEKEKSFGDHLGSFLDNIDVGKVIELSQAEEKDELVSYLAFKAVSGGGYYGQAYIDKKSNQLIIAHRGTDNLISAYTEGQKVDRKIGSQLWEMVRDLDDDYEIYSGKIPKAQFLEARKFTASAISAFEEKHGKKPKVVHTGHSLGAVLAELCAVESNCKAITFESPGTAPLLEELSSMTYGKFDHKKFDAKKADVTSYNAEPNRINTLHKHIGKVIPLYKEKEYQKAYEDYSLFENISNHSIDTVLTRFNKRSGKPKKIK